MLNTGALLQQNRYRIVQRIGGGGMGVVYLAEDMRLGARRCAIKEFSPDQLSEQDRTWATQTFRQEAAILSRLNHRGLTNIYDYFGEGASEYLVMEMVEGETLETHLDRAPDKRLSQAEALAIANQLCDVLEYLHQQTPPIVFRDLKPGNIMLTPSGQVKLIDFGIARLFKQGQSRDTISLGTPGYAAPEQYGGKGQTDPRSDIYSLGVVLHQMLTGYDPTLTPFNLPVTRTLNSNISPALEGVIRKAVHVDPVQRFQSVQEMHSCLQTDAAPRRGVARRGRVLSLAALALLLLGIGGVIAWNSGLGQHLIVPMTTNTLTPTVTASATPTPTRTATSTFTATATRRATATPLQGTETATATPTATVTRLRPTLIRVINTPTPIPTATPTCPAGQFWDDIMKRCKGTGGPKPQPTR